jgi:hypothetical protein
MWRNLRIAGCLSCWLFVGIMLSVRSAASQSFTSEFPHKFPQTDQSYVDTVEAQPLPDAPPSSACTAKVPSNSALSSSRGFVTAPSAYAPLSKHCKFELFLRQTYSPYTFVSVVYEATWAQMMAQWPQYGGGMAGWGKRLGATVADTESRRFIQGFLLSTALHQDPRYFPSGKNKLLARGWYAVTRVLITRSDLGQNETNTSELLGALSTSSLENAYYPAQYRTFGNTMSRFAGALSSDATSDLLREFTPDLKRLFHRHAPRRIQELEQKLPLPADDKW